MRRGLRIVIVTSCVQALLLVTPLIAGSPPPPCGFPVMQSQFALRYTGLTSGCNSQVPLGPTCIAGETLSFQVASSYPGDTFHCPVAYRFNWSDGRPPVITDAPNATHGFTQAGAYIVTLDVIGYPNTIQISRPLVIAAGSTVPTLTGSFQLVLLFFLVAVAIHRLR
jgi:hypothetical protein